MNKATTFNKEIIPQINRVLKFALENPYSDFYRKKYKNLGIKEISSYEDFQKIPFLAKEEFRDLALEKRTFIPEDDISHYSLSGGITNNGRPTVIPHSSFNFETFSKNNFDEKKLRSLGARRIMTLFIPTSVFVFKIIALPKKYCEVIPGDITNLPLMAMIAKEARITGIVTLPTRLYFFIDHLKNIGFDLGQIKWISLGAEFCSEQKFAYFRSELPNALIEFRYGNSEAGGAKGYRCDHLAGNEAPDIFHPAISSLTEMIGEKGEILPLGETGELVHTHLDDRAFPLIRYKMGDIGTLTERRCACGSHHTLKLLGRRGFDVMKFRDFTLNVQGIENSLDPIRQYIEMPFQMHIFEEKTANGQLVKLQLWLKPKKEFETKTDNALKKLLEEKISGGLYLAENTTLQNLIDRKKFLPLEITFETPNFEKYTRWKNIISHLS